MGRNVEIKARASQFPQQMAAAQAIADQGPLELLQTDTFFQAANGRLKLREFADGTAELIYYHRADQAEAKTSNYWMYPSHAPALLKQILSQAHGVRGVVKKRRTLFLVGPARIHFDQVERLGEFIELEVVLQPTQAIDEGRELANQLCEKLAIRRDDLLPGAYVDMLTPMVQEQGGEGP